MEELSIHSFFCRRAYAVTVWHRVNWKDKWTSVTLRSQLMNYFPFDLLRHSICCAFIFHYSIGQMTANFVSVRARRAADSTYAASRCRFESKVQSQRSVWKSFPENYFSLFFSLWRNLPREREKPRANTADMHVEITLIQRQKGMQRSRQEKSVPCARRKVYTVTLVNE